MPTLRALALTLLALLATAPAARPADDTGKKESPVPPGMIYVPGGKFMMGTDTDEPTSESPMHEVVVGPYLIARHEVANGQYSKFIDAKGYEKKEYWSAEGWKWLTEDAKRKVPAAWESRKKELEDEFDRHPVNGVSWYEAEAYAKFAGARLPTEAEWERAARGTDGRIFPWGNKFESGLRSKPKEERGKTYPIGANPADVSPVGAYDMGGNVSEWTASEFGPYPGTKYRSRYWGEDRIQTLRVARGGCYRWIDLVRTPVSYKCRAAYRQIDSPPGNGCEWIGFRLAMDAPETRKSE